MKFANRHEAAAHYAELFRVARKESESAAISMMAELGRRDLFFLLTRIMGRKDMDHDWHFARCQEVQQSPDGRLDLWAREHYKSTIYNKSVSCLKYLTFLDKIIQMSRFSAVLYNSVYNSHPLTRK
jgi:hypothetical protein